ncbi:hypothetical protein IGI37_000573 [Enterococcus sp. AZ194]|uniref:ABC transporter permease n=1 Tax=Enterococcus sp. AZ194 TaxID=2774629 RepID=UPI003F2556F4
MRVRQLMLGEIYQTKKSLLLFLLALSLTIGAFMTALPFELLQRESAAPSVKVAISMPVDSKELTGLVGILDKNDLIKTLEIVSEQKGKLGVMKGDYDLYVAMPEEFEAALFERQTGTIELYAKNALVGNVVYQIAYEMIQTLNNLQSLSLDYYQVLKTSDQSYKEARKSSQTFDLELIQMLLDRNDWLAVHSGVSQYPLQLSSLFLFLALIGISMFSGLVTSQQFKQGTMKKLLFYKYPVSLILTCKFILSWLISLPFLLLLFGLSHYFSLQIEGFRLVLGASCLLLFLFLLTTGIAFLVGQVKKETRLFLLYASGALLMLFLGGLIYPLYNQPAIITQSNPAWYAQVIIENAVMGADWNMLPIVNLLIGSGGLTGILFWRWRKWA